MGMSYVENPQPPAWRVCFTTPDGREEHRLYHTLQEAEAGLDYLESRGLSARVAMEGAMNEQNCQVCGGPPEERVLCPAHGVGHCPSCTPEYTGRCREHAEYCFECDAGHRWQGGHEEYTCPACGGFAV
jgi:hypothetical protein